MTGAAATWLVLSVACTLTTVALVVDCGGGDLGSALAAAFWLGSVALAVIGGVAGRRSPAVTLLAMAAGVVAAVAPSVAFGLSCAA